MTFEKFIELEMTMGNVVFVVVVFGVITIVAGLLHDHIVYKLQDIIQDLENKLEEYEAGNGENSC